MLQKKMKLTFVHCSNFPHKIQNIYSWASLGMFHFFYWTSFLDQSRCVFESVLAVHYIISFALCPCPVVLLQKCLEMRRDASFFGVFLVCRGKYGSLSYFFCILREYATDLRFDLPLNACEFLHRLDTNSMQSDCSDYALPLDRLPFICPFGLVCLRVILFDTKSLQMLSYRTFKLFQSLHVIKTHFASKASFGQLSFHSKGRDLACPCKMHQNFPF